MKDIIEWIFVFVVCGVGYYCCNGHSNETNSISDDEEWQPAIKQQAKSSESVSSNNNSQNNDRSGVVNFDYNVYVNSTTNRAESNIQQSTLTENIECGRVYRYIDDTYSYIKKAWNASSIKDKQFYAKKAEDCLDDARRECDSLRFHSDNSDNRYNLGYAQSELDDAEDYAKKSKEEDDDPEMIDYYLNKCVDEINDAIEYLNKLK